MSLSLEGFEERAQSPLQCIVQRSRQAAGQFSPGVVHASGEVLPPRAEVVPELLAPLLPPFPHLAPLLADFCHVDGGAPGGRIDLSPAVTGTDHHLTGVVQSHEGGQEAATTRACARADVNEVTVDEAAADAVDGVSRHAAAHDAA